MAEDFGRSFEVMGTVASALVPAHEVERIGVDGAARIIDACEAFLVDIDLRMSHYRADSEMTLVTTGQIAATEASDDIIEVLTTCAELFDESKGVFTIKNPQTGQIDTAGYVKGWAVQGAVDNAADLGAEHLLLGVGGDVAVLGSRLADRPWQIAIADPQVEAGVAAVVIVSDAIATSGTSERGFHIWNVRPEDEQNPALLSMTVLGPDLALADAYATIGFAMGFAGLEWVATRGDYEAFAVLADGRRFGTPGLPELMATA